MTFAAAWVVALSERKGMDYLRTSALTALLFLAVCADVCSVDVPPAGESFDPIVIVMTRFAGRTEIGNGFVVADGSLIVTARHLVFDESTAGDHSMQGLVSVITPYLGRASDTRIIAHDEELDLALLETPWRGHPAYALADDQALLSAERLLVAGMPDVGPNVFADAPPPERIDIETERLPVDYVALRLHTPRYIALAGTGRLRKGWSGSPILLPDTSLAVGCHTRLVARGPRRENAFTGAEGPALAQIGPLLNAVGLGLPPLSGDTSIDRPGDADDAFLRCISAIHYAAKDHWTAVLQHAQVLTRLRLQSAFGYRMAAKAAAELRQSAKAETLFQRALAFDPESPLTRLYYVEYLARNRKTDEAVEVLERMWESDVPKSAVAMEFFNVFFSSKDYVRCIDVLEQALQDEPRNAYLWLWMGVCRQKTEDNDAALESFSRAVELCPERVVFRSSLAALLETLGRIDEAETQYRLLVRTQPDVALPHFLLARFLAARRPDAREEALREAQTALDLPQTKDLTGPIIEKLIDELHPAPSSQDGASPDETSPESQSSIP